jgi:glycosyltransferase involved in cell wall biosynthesis
VIAFEGGSVQEIVEDGITGFVVKTVEEATDAVKKLDTVDRSECRARFEERFSAKRMCQDYVRAYRQLLASRSTAHSTLLLPQNIPGESVADALANTE